MVKKHVGIFFLVIFLPIIFLYSCIICSHIFRKKYSKYIKNKTARIQINSFLKKLTHIIVNTDNECCICLYNIDVDSECVKLSCNHLYHTDCIRDWYINSDNKTCPVCRKEITI